MNLFRGKMVLGKCSRAKQNVISLNWYLDNRIPKKLTLESIKKRWKYRLLIFILLHRQWCTRAVPHPSSLRLFLFKYVWEAAFGYWQGWGYHVETVLFSNRRWDKLRKWLFLRNCHCTCTSYFIIQFFFFFLVNDWNSSGTWLHQIQVISAINVRKMVNVQKWWQLYISVHAAFLLMWS